jgi:hypothetical protein
MAVLLSKIFLSQFQNLSSSTKLYSLIPTFLANIILMILVRRAHVRVNVVVVIVINKRDFQQPLHTNNLSALITHIWNVTFWKATNTHAFKPEHYFDFNISFTHFCNSLSSATSNSNTTESSPNSNDASAKLPLSIQHTSILSNPSFKIHFIIHHLLSNTFVMLSSIPKNSCPSTVGGN